MNFLSNHAPLHDTDHERGPYDTINTEPGPGSHGLPTSPANRLGLDTNFRGSSLNTANNIQIPNESFSNNQDVSIDFLHNNNNLIPGASNAQGEILHMRAPAALATDANPSSASLAISNINESQLNVTDNFDPQLETNIREIIYSILKSHTIGFFFFIFVLVYLKFSISYHYGLVFLWLVDIYGIVASANVLADHSEPGQRSRHILEIIESFFMIVFKILMLIVLETRAFTMLYTLIPFVAFFFVKGLSLFCYKKIEVTTILSLLFALQLLNFSLKYDGIVDWDWREVFWSYWVVFSILIGITFAMFLLLISKCTTYLFADTNRYELRGVFWLFCIFTGGTTLSCAFVVTFIDWLDMQTTDTTNQFAATIYVIIAYCMFLTVLTLAYLRDIEKFLLKLAPLDTENRNGDKKNSPQKKPEKIEIPKFLMRISSTYFGRASENDIKTLQKPKERTRRDKKGGNRLKHLRTRSTNSFDYGRLTKNSENTQNTQLSPRDSQNLITIPSARSKEDIESARMKKSTDGVSVDALKLPKALQEILQKKIELQLPILPQVINTDQFGYAQKTLSESDRRHHTETDRIEDANAPENYVTENLKHQYPIQLEPIKSDDDNYSKLMAQLSLNTEKLELPPDKALDISTGSPSKDSKDLKKKHRRYQSEILMMRPKTVDESTDETNRSKVISPKEGKEALASPQNMTDRSVTACLICFDKQPDAVFMECGHGGVCYECSLEVWKATNECYLCRKPIAQVLQLDLKNYAKSNVIKVLSSTQMVTYEDDEKSDQGGPSDDESSR